MGTAIVLVIVIAVIGLAAWSVIKDKKKGKSSCGCDCKHCAMSAKCHGGK